MPIDKLPLNKLKTTNDVQTAAGSIKTTNANVDSSIFVGLSQADFAKMVDSKKTGSSDDSIFFQNVDATGSDDVFQAMDKNGDGKLDQDEINAISKVDGNDKAISGNEMNIVFYNILSKALNALNIKDQPINQAALNLLPTGNDYYNMPASNGYNGGSNGADGASNSADQAQKSDPKADIQKLEEQRKQVIDEADKSIQAKNEEMDKAVQGSDKLDSELKEQFETNQKAVQDCDQQITAKDGEIDKNKSAIQDIDSSVSALEGELSKLDTNTKDDKTNQSNSARKTEIQKQLDDKKAQKQKLEDQEKTLENDKKDLETKRTDAQKTLDDSTQKVDEADPSIKSKVDQLKKDIEDLKAKKDKDVADIDKQIDDKKKEENDQQKKMGESVGEASNGLGSAVVQDALKYIGANENDGSYKKFTNGREEAWCADFASYVVKEAYEKAGKKLPEGFGSASVANIKSWGEQNGCFTRTSNMSDKANYMANNIKAGDLIIFGEDQHVGIVESVDGDGTVHTVEGNTSDQVARRDYNASNARITGFVQLDKYKGA